MPFTSEPETSEKAVKRTKSMMSAEVRANGGHERISHGTFIL